MLKHFKLSLTIFLVFLSSILLAVPLLYRQKMVFAPFEAAEAGKQETKLLVIAPHCDDEILATGGVIHQALARGTQVKVVVMTNGDAFSKAARASFPALDSPQERYLQLAKVRQQESIAGLKILGLPKKKIIFLGYPDKGLALLWSQHWDQDKPYLNPNIRFNHSPYPSSYNPGTFYTGWNVIQDLTKIIREYQPTDIYYPHPNDLHPDHWAANSFVKYVLTQEKPENTQEHLYLVHRGMWPTPWFIPRFLMPPQSLTAIGTQWLEVPLQEETVYLKQQAILAHRTQIKVMKHYLLSFARANELFGSYPDSLLSKGKKEVLIQDPKADLWKSKTNGAGDIIQVYGNLDDQKLELELITRSPISAKVNYQFHLRFLAKEQATQLADLTIKDRQAKFSLYSQNSLPAITGLKIKIKNNVLSVEMPLSSLPPWENLYLNIETREGFSLVDKTAWRIIKLLN